MSGRPLSVMTEELATFAADLDFATVDGAGAQHVMEEAARIRNIAADLHRRASARVEETGRFRRDGYKDAATAAAHASGCTRARALDDIETAKRLEQLPVASEAARRGELSAEQAVLIADAAAVNPDAEAALVRAARKSSLAELKAECARAKAEGDPAGHERAYQRHRAERRLRHWTDREGRWHLHMQGTPDVGAEIMAAVNRERDRVFAAARKACEREHPDAYGFDAAVNLLTNGGGQAARPRGSDTKVIVRVDIGALLRGCAAGGETCEVAGFGPVPVSVVRELVDSGNAFLAAVATNGVDVVNIAHLGRRPTAFQRTALQWLYPTCVVEGCGNTVALDYEHDTDWAQTLHTLLAETDRKCGHHHDLKTRYGWSLVAGTGKRAFVPPDHPDHPRQARAGPAHARAG